MRLHAVSTSPEVSRLAFRPGSAPAWIDETRLAVADKDAGQVVVLDRTAGGARRLGRRGQGPGELLLPMWIRARPDGSMVVGDGLGLRAVEFTADGTTGRMAYFPGRPLAVTEWSGDTVTAVWADGLQPVVGSVTLDSDDTVAHFRPFAVSPGLVASATMMGGPSVFLSAVADGRGRTLLSGGMQYAVYSFDRQGRAGPVFARGDVEPEFMSEREFGEFSENLTRSLRAGGPWAMQHLGGLLAQSRSRPKPYFRMGSLSVDEKGRLWVVTSHRTGAGTAVDVFAPDGAFLARLDVPGKVGSVAPRLPYLAVLREGVGGVLDGVEGIDVYRVVE
jgi:hypothetical protein